MRRKWILIGLAAGLLAAAISGGVALAWGGVGHGNGWGWGRGNHEERNAAVASKVAGILGTDEQETTDAITQAQKEVREETAEAALQDVAGRVAATLGTDAAATADAMRQVATEMSGEALETKLQAAIDDGRITEEQAQEYRDKAASSGWRGLGHGFKGGDSQEYANRVGAILDVDGGDVADAIKQALTDIRTEAMETKLQAAIDSGKITEEEAAEIREKIASGEWKGFGKRGRHGDHGGKGRRGHGRGRHNSGGAPAETHAPENGGDST